MTTAIAAGTTAGTAVGAAAGTLLCAPDTSATLEERLAAVWSEVLDGVPVGPSDNFFDLGGDSLLILETIALAREDGIDYSPVDLIEHQTVAELAARIRAAGTCGAQRTDDIHEAEDTADTAGIPLTAAQRHLFLHQPHPQYVTQSVLWRVDAADAGVLDEALSAVLDAHDSFRLRLDGPWPGSQLDGSRLRLSERTGFTLERVDLSGLAADERAAAVLEHTTRLQRSVDPVDGPTVRGALLDLGPAGQRLFLTAHHLAVDSASWRILRGELVSACGQLSTGQKMGTAAPSAPYGRWARQVGALRPEGDARGQDGALPWARWRRGEPGPAPFARATSATVRSTPQLTASLLEGARRAWGTGMDRAVLAAVSAAVAEVFGCAQVTCEVELHGRDSAPAGLDISRTTGWFTDLRTVSLPAGQAPVACLVAVADQELRAGRPAAGDGAVPAALVNYLGRFTDRPGERFTEADEPFADDRHPANHLTHPVEVHAAVNDTRLVTVITCDGAAPAGLGAAELAEAYQRALEALASGTHTARVPS